MQHQVVHIIDFGSQYTQLIARRVRELNVYCEIHPYNKLPELNAQVKGIILSGGPSSVLDSEAPLIDLDTLRRKVAVLGICYGAQLMVQKGGGRVQPSSTREYGRARLKMVQSNHVLFNNVTDNCQVWMSHSDTIGELPPGFEVIAHTDAVRVAAYAVTGEPTYGLQFHPEVMHTKHGKDILANFLYKVCACSGDWSAGSFVDETVAELRKQLGDDHVVLGLSGGVDSGVAAMLLHRAIGKRLHCIFIDNGLLRKNETRQVESAYGGLGLNVTHVDATSRFYKELSGVAEPERKRKIIGKVFIDVFDEKAHEISDEVGGPGVRWLGQGTIYPDVIESVSVKGPSATIKSHHNVGGLPDKMKLKVVEPLRNLFKDEVRRVGRAMEMNDALLSRHPFPGPGLGVRILGDITPEKVRMLQEADAIYIDELHAHGLYHQIWQAGTVFLPVRSVGVMGDERTYENVVCLRAVTSVDGMTADWFQFPHEFLASVSSAIINKVKGINRVVYDISSKPPSTIEWE